ncbi:unnamed protein product [Mytilus coruscus]|uniref:DDE-1 domain-containing protein n=1 Tax=Mytilus coruscus TaxID=42192 RepID=A0A6J8BBA7_MYTCO|nr:unnamed protein product [Mytilus coruscus]
MMALEDWSQPDEILETDATLSGEILFYAAKYNFEIKAVHFTGVENRTAHILSRWHSDSRFEDLFYELPVIRIEPGTFPIVSVSIAKYVKLENADVFAFLGASIREITCQLNKNKGSIYQGFNCLIIHCGTNDIHVLSIDQFKSGYCNLISTAKLLFPSMVIALSGILPRPVDFEETGQKIEEVNMALYTRSEVVDLATDYAVYMELREKTKPFTLNWFYSFMGRWPELKTIKARGLAISRAKSQENINSYFQELETILVKYNLTDKPHCIYSDEKGVNFQHKPPNVVGAKESKPPGMTSERSPTVTIIGAGNALGTQIPPYLIFAGARMNNRLIEDCTNGTSGSVSGSGWSNTDIFHKYLGEHFIKYAHGLTDDQPVLLIYDGHKSHVALRKLIISDDDSFDDIYAVLKILMSHHVVYVRNVSQKH